jgi:hypothetical protein
MATLVWDPQLWAQRQFNDCDLKDQRRNQRLCHFATQVAAHPDASTPQQAESWGALKGAYRLINCADVTFQALIAPHCQQTRQDCQAGDVKLILNDTTELDYTAKRKTRGLGPIGNGHGRGFFLHSGLMVAAATGQVEGMAAQEIFYRQEKAGKKVAKNTRRKSSDRESAVWGRVIDRIGRPPTDVTWIHVCDRGADDYEVMLRAIRQGCGFVIRAAKLNRTVQTLDGRSLPLRDVLDGLPAQGQRDISVKATKKEPARIARVTLRMGEIFVPLPKVLTPWIREHAPPEPLRVSVVELREETAPPKSKPVRWVLYATEAAKDVARADRIIAHYEKRPKVEEYHKALKTGCAVQKRQYRTGQRLERIVGVLSVVAVRLLQMRSAARETPERPAEEVAPSAWVAMLKAVRNAPKQQPMSIREFVRQLAGLGGHLLRKGDGEPGWMTIWRGHKKLVLLLRGARLAQKTTRQDSGRVPRKRQAACPILGPPEVLGAQANSAAGW